MSTNHNYLKSLAKAEADAVEVVQRSRADLAAADEVLHEAKAERAAAVEQIEEVEAAWSSLELGDPDPAELVAAQAALRRADLRLTAAKRARETAQSNLVGTDAAGARAVADWVRGVLGESITVASTWLVDPPTPSTVAQLPALVVTQSTPTKLGTGRNAGLASARCTAVYFYDEAVHHSLTTLKGALKQAASPFKTELGMVSGVRRRDRRVSSGAGMVNVSAKPKPKVGRIVRESMQIEAAGLVLSGLAPFVPDGPAPRRLADSVAANIAGAMVEPYAASEIAWNRHARPDRVKVMPTGPGRVRYDAERVETAAVGATLSDPETWTRSDDGTVTAEVSGQVACVFYSEPQSGSWNELLHSVFDELSGTVTGGCLVQSCEWSSVRTAPHEGAPTAVAEALRGDGVSSPRWARPGGGYSTLIEFSAAVEWRDAAPILEEVAA